MWADGRTDRHTQVTQLIVIFRNCANVPKRMGPGGLTVSTIIPKLYRAILHTALTAVWYISYLWVFGCLSVPCSVFGRKQKLHVRIKEGRKEGRKATWIRDILRKNFLPKHVTEGAIKGRSDGKTRVKV